MVADRITTEDLEKLERLGRHDLIRAYHAALTPLERFIPRNDCLEEHDQQTAFVESDAKFAICLGGTGCIAGESRVYDPVTRRYRRVDQIAAPFHVLSFDEQIGRVAIGLANRPFIKGVADLYLVELSNGQSFIATGQHRVLTDNGFSGLLEFAVCRLPSIAEPYPSASRQAAGQALSLPQGDAHAHTRPRCIVDGPGHGSARSLLYRESGRPSMMDSSRPDMIQSDASGNYASLSLSTLACRSRVSICRQPLSFRVPQQCPRTTFPAVRTSRACAQQANRCDSTLPSFIPAECKELFTSKITKITFLRRDTYYDFTVHIFHNYIMAGVVHHNSGKTQAAAVKTARYVLNTPPMRPRCPFWIVGDTYETVCSVCWEEKLSHYIPKSRIRSIDWLKVNRQWPLAVTLRDPRDPSKPGWVLEFKSYSQGFATMKARSIGGYWFNEEVPLHIVTEVQGRCREYDSPGWADFTPIEVVSPDWPEMYDDPPEGWRFFHLNVEKNRHLAKGWAARYLASVPEDERETRRIGVFATFSGQVFKEWRKPVHVIEPFKLPHDWNRLRGIDFGFSNPFACVWVAKDKDGRYYVYDEHYETGRLNAYHAEQIHGGKYDGDRINPRKWQAKHPHFGASYSDHDAQQRAELNRLGVYCTPANKSNVLGGISFLRSLMMIQGDGRPKFYVFSNCVNLIREIRGYHWPMAIGAGQRMRNPKELPVDFENHAIDAVRYAVYSDARGSAKAPRADRREWQPRESQQFRAG